MNSAFFKKGYGTIVNWVAISFVGILLLILGVWQLFHESVALSNTLNVWSILVALWAFVDYLFDISKKVNALFHATETKNNVDAWRMTLSVAWVVLSFRLAFAIAQVPVPVNFNGFSLLAMGLTTITFYLGFRS